MKEVIYGKNKCHITPRYVSRTHVPIFRKELIHISKDWGAIKHVSNLDRSVALGKSLCAIIYKEYILYHSILNGNSFLWHFLLVFLLLF